jgi:NAD(P)-dependent dehydrogenase (short-subunit alcohol dehydrogenase family)
MANRSHSNPLTAILSGLLDQRSKDPKVAPVPPGVRLDGRTCLVTGANSGLGKAVAIDLAKRGGRVLMACRGGHPEAGEDVRRASGSDAVEMLRVDLSDFASVHALCDSLVERGDKIDVAVLNAGLMPLSARKSAQGFEVMMAVHFLANRILTDRWIADRVIVPSAEPKLRPRIIFVASEAHQSSIPIDFERLGGFVDYGLKDGMAEYGRTKLLMVTLAQELSRRLNPAADAGDVVVNVFSLCPGPVASNIAREAPIWLKPIVPPLLKLLFRSPEAAAEPVVLLACGRQMQDRTGVYLHMMREKAPSELASSPDNGRRLWEKCETLLAAHPR